MDVPANSGLTDAGFRLVFDHALDGMWVVTADGQLAAVNRSACALLGAAPGALEGRHVGDLLADPGQWRAHAAELGAHARARSECTIVRADGARVPIEMASQRLPDGGAVTIVRDISERLRSQRVSDERMRATIDGRPDLAVQWYDLDGRVRLWNRASQHMFGFSADEAVGRTLAELIYTPEQQAEFNATLAEIAASGTPVGPVELTFKRRDGSTGTCLSTIFQIPGEGDTPFFVCMDVDLSEMKRVETELRQAQKEEVLGRLAGGMAHDFNNLLTAIVGFAELGSANVAPGSEEQECFGFILRSAQRGAALTSNLLAFAKKKVVAPRALVVRDVVERLVPLMKPLVGERIEIATRHDASPDEVTIDLGSLEQVVMNLVVNARDAMPQGGRLTLETRAVDIDGGEAGPGHYLQLEVRDTGQAVAPELQERIFEPFSSTRSVAQGTGLALATCASIVRQAGGLIAMQSRPDEGTVFRVHLPASRARAPEIRRENKGVRGDETILLVEDEPAVRALTERVLRSFGYRVLVAGDGREALEVAAAHEAKIDLLLSDLIMPEMGGLALAEAMRGVRPTTKVLLCSGYSADPELAARGYAVLDKPYTPALLGRRIREVLDGP